MSHYFYELHHWIAIRNGHPMREQNLDISLNVARKDNARYDSSDDIVIAKASMTDRQGGNPYIYTYGTGIPISEELFYTLIDRGDIGLRKTALVGSSAGLTHDEFWEYYKNLSARLKNLPSIDCATDDWFAQAADAVGCLIVNLNYAHKDKVPFETVADFKDHYSRFVRNMKFLHDTLKAKPLNKD